MDMVEADVDESQRRVPDDDVQAEQHAELQHEPVAPGVCNQRPRVVRLLAVSRGITGTHRDSF